MVDVFISYARRDRAQIEALANALVENGFSVWWDHQIAGGAAFAAEIERALNGAKSVIVAWSVHSVQSEWVIDEAGVAKKDGKLIPIRLDATHAPIGFRQYQEVDFSRWDGSRHSSAFQKLASDITRYLRGGVGQQPNDLVEERAQSTYADAIVVLPLENLIGDSGQQYLVDGIHEALITDLSKVGSLKVISRTSSKRYANTDKSAREIGAELGVTRLVEGSVMRAGDDLRISVQLIDTRNDTHLWADSFDNAMTNVLKLQHDVARAIVGKMSVVLTPDEQSRLTAAPRIATEAYEAYLKGMYHWYKLTPQDMQAALEQFDAALGVDPDYAPAHAGIGMIWAGIQQMGVAPPRVAGPKIKDAADKALTSDPGLFQAHFTHSMYLTWSAWDWARADKAYTRALELNKNFSDAYAYYAHYLSIVNRFDESEAMMEKALNLDPFNPLIRSLYGACLAFWERYDEAIDQLNMVVAAAPGHWLPFQVLRFAYGLNGMAEKAFDTTKTLYEILDRPSVVSALEHGFKNGGAMAGYAAAGDALCALAESSYIAPTQIALMYGVAGESDKAADWFEKGYEARDPEIPYIGHQRRFAQIAPDHPKIQALIAKMGYPC